jgi:hypothetical protein
LVIGVLAAEAYFRPLPRRIAEYVGWAVLSLAYPARVERLSIGIAQVRVHRWVEAGLLTGPLFSLASLRRVLSVNANYDACDATVKALFPKRPSDYLDVAQHYHGARSPYYAWIVRVGTTLLGLGIWTRDLGIAGRVPLDGVKVVISRRVPR